MHFQIEFIFSPKCTNSFKKQYEWPPWRKANYCTKLYKDIYINSDNIDYKTPHAAIIFNAELRNPVFSVIRK